MTYRRWYDADPKLSGVVHAMELLNRDTQMYFADKVLELSNVLLAEQGGDAYIEKLDERKKAGLEKSQAKKRWYDRQENLHQAFNNLYALSSLNRREIATKLESPIQIVEGYEKHCAQQGQKPEAKIIEEILRSSFVEGTERTRKLYALYMYALSEPSASQAARRKKEEPTGLWSGLLRKFQASLL